MRPIQERLYRLTVDDIGRVVDVQEAPIINPDLVPGEVEDGLDSIRDIL